MKIKITKNEQNNPLFDFDGKLLEFNYDNLTSFIDFIIDNDEKLEFETDEDLVEYEKLLMEIATNARTEDFKKAVEELNEAKKKLDEEDAKLFSSNKNE